MAEETKPWCFDSATQTLGELSEAQNEYISQFQAVHDQITQEEWTEIVDPFNLEDHGLKNFNTKPTLQEWFDLYEPVDCWTEPRKILGSYNILEEMEEIVKQTNNILNTSALFGSGTQAQIPEMVQNLFFGLAEGNWKNIKLLELDSVLFELSELGFINDNDYQSIFDQINKIQIKFELLLCPDKEDFKQQYLDAIKALAQKEIDRLEDDKSAATSSSDTFDGGKAAQAAADITGIQQEIDNLKQISIDKFLKDIEQAFEEAFADNLVFSEQCMLLTFLPELLVSNSSKGLPYVNPESSNYPLKAQGESFGFINKLVVDPSQKELFELKNEVVSQLVPYIRLYKVEKDENGKDKQIEIKFDTNISNDLNTSSNTLRRQRGYGVGMNSFTFSYDGTDPFSAKKAISAKLSIFASTFDDLLRERDGFKYADLALKTGGIAGGRTLDDIEKENAEKLNFRLKAVVGWNVPRETFVGFSEEIRNAMYNSYITVYLTPTIHSFDFDETGAVNFDIEYLAYIEDAMAQRSFNIFSNVAVEQTAMEATMNLLNKMDCDMSSPEFQKLKKVNEEFVSTVNLKAYSSLVSKLAARDKIYFLNMTYDDVARILQNPDDDDIVFPKPYTNSMVSETTSQAMNTAASLDSGSLGSLEQISRNILSVAAVSQDNESIPYFYLEDLVAVAMDNIEQTLKKGQDTTSKSEYLKFITERGAMNINIYRDLGKLKSIPVEYKNNLQQFQQMRILLGPIEIFSPSRNYASFKTTLANIPISLNYFFEFMSDKVLSKEIINYPITKFIKDLVNDLIKNFLNSDGCTRVSNKQKININSTTISAYNRSINPRAKWQSTDKPSHDDITYFLSEGKRPEGPILQLNGKRDAPQNMPIEQMINYYVFSAGRKYPNDQYVGNKAQDENVGIFHYILGRDRGIIKNISLERTTATGLKEVRFEQEGYNGLEQLREVYNVKVDSFLNVQTFPGTYIYVDPRGFSPNTTEDLTRFGIGGYCMITKTSHTIRPGEATTTIDAAWVASKEGDSDANKQDSANGEKKQRKPEGNEKIRKCVVGVIDLGRLVTGRDNLGLTLAERGKLGDELVKAAKELGTNEGIYTV
jgi:hypothetical protein